ncbi:glutamate racemase [Candidatus Peregrinibacteria bacterium]|nr:MAG: glutamate racemase [Candidatus Peregrinibacteria bacterium]
MIGLFDSGFGGLTVLREYLKTYPEYDYLYLGDQANNPYGSHSAERVEALLMHHVDWLVSQGCELIIVACNTASADALRAVQQKYQGKPVILGVIIPAAEEALRQSRFGRIGVIGTKGTVASGAYERELKKYAASLYHPSDRRALDSVVITQQACPLLVPLIEEGLVNHPVTNRLIRDYLRPLKQANIDTLILGCTHYPLLQNTIERIAGKSITVISSAAAAAQAMADYFKRHPDLAERLSKNGTRRYVTTDQPKRFAELGSQFLGEKFVAESLGH